jgi:hypothetical protein
MQGSNRRHHLTWYRKGVDRKDRERRVEESEGGTRTPNPKRSFSLMDGHLTNDKSQIPSFGVSLWTVNVCYQCKGNDIQTLQ